METIHKCPHCGNDLQTKEKVLPALVNLRDSDIVCELIQGKSNKEIAKALGLTEQYIKNRLVKIYKRTGCLDRVQLTVKVMSGQL